MTTIGSNEDTIQSNIELVYDRVWLYKKYVDEQLSDRQIAEIAGCERKTVARYRKQYNIARDKPYLSKVGDRQWLRKKYVDEQLSDRQIAEIAGCSAGTVERWRKHHSISSRDRIKALQVARNKDIPIPEKLREYIDGTLLGDAHIDKGSETTSRFVLGSRHLEYAQHVEQLLKNNGYTVRVVDNITKRGKYYLVSSCYTLQLKEYREKWYPDGIKRVPKDLRLSPVKCLYWYLDDGNMTPYKNRVISIRLSTDGFTSEENNLLIKKLKNVLGVATGIKLLKRNAIALNKEPASKFLKYIGGHSPVSCFEYKFDPALERSYS